MHFVPAEHSDWARFENPRVHRTKVQLPPGVRLPPHHTNWVVGRWWIVKPREASFGGEPEVGRDTWTRALHKEGVSYIFYPRKAASYRIREHGEPASVSGLKAVLVDLFGLANDVGSETLGDLGHYLCAIGYKEPEESE